MLEWVKGTALVPVRYALHPVVWRARDKKRSDRSDNFAVASGSGRVRPLPSAIRGGVGSDPPVSSADPRITRARNARPPAIHS